MKIAYSDLLEHIESNPDIEDISSKLFQLGHEHEIDNELFDIEITPNRGDCLSLKGILRDLAVFYDINFNLDIYTGNIPNMEFNFTNNATSACPEISFLKIDINEEVIDYKDYLESYFNKLNVPKNNFFTDISNYLSYEMGQPTHCYDAKTIKGELILDHIDQECSFKTLLGKKILLNSQELVFLNNKEPINLAGVVGGDATSCSNNTKSVIVECAYFNPEEIIGKSVKYDVKSDAAYKFERNVDRAQQDNVLRRFIKIVEDHTPIINIEIIRYEYHKHELNEIVFDAKKINKIIGITLSDYEIQNYLTNLGFTIDNNRIKIPSFRNDITSANDIAEEIARSIGYDNIPLSEINFTNLKKNNSTSKKEECIKQILFDNGFYEVINNPFEEDASTTSIKIDNPLDSNKTFLRTNLKKSLIENLLYNERRQKDSVKLFEFSDVYSSKECIEKKRVLGLICSGRVGKNYIDFTKKIDELYLKSIFMDFTNINKFNIETISRDNLNTKLKNQIIYLEHEINEINIENYEYDNDTINFKNLPKYKSISEYPSSNRDLSFLIKDFTKLKVLEDLLLRFRHKLLKETYIFDYYKNEKSNEIKIGFRFVFQSLESTIQDADVNVVIDDIIKLSLAIDSISIPGLQINDN